VEEWTAQSRHFRHSRLQLCRRAKGSHLAKQNGPVKLPETQASFNGCVFSAQTSLKGKDTSQAWLFHVTNNPAARWMQICDMYPHMVGACERKSRLLLRGPETCFHCTFDAIIPKHNQSSTYDSHDSEHPVYFVLL